MNLSIFSIIALLLCAAGASEAASRNSTVRPRIVGGQLARDGQFPYIVSLRNNNRPNCGGSIISPRWVVTAAHCVHENSGRGTRIAPSRLSVRAGSNRLESGGQIYQVSQVRVHPRYAVSAFDVCVLQLARAVQFNNRVRSIPYSRTPVRVGSAVTVIGWGNTQTTGFMTDQLRFTTLNAIDDNECFRHHPRSESVMCLGHPVGRGICQGDSGGPAVLNGQLVGLMSFTSSTGCGTAIPDGFARVSNLFTWIQQNSR